MLRVTADRSAAPPGSWRLLAPALLTWGITAVAAHTPGLAPYLARGALVCGILLCGTALLGLGRPRPRARRLHPWCGTAFLLIGLLLIVMVRMELRETAAQSADLHAAVEGSAQLHLRIELSGYPEAVSGGDAPAGFTKTHAPHAEVTGGVPQRMTASARILPQNASQQTMLGRTPVHIRVWLDDDRAAEWGPGQKLRVAGRLSAEPPGRSAHYLLRITSVNGVEDASPGTALAVSLRRQLVVSAAQTPGASLVPGFAVGDTTLVSEELTEAMRESSLLHLVAVSGANCALIIGAVLALAGKLGLGRRLRLPCAAAALLGFVVIVGPDASVQRASIMAAVVLLSEFGGKRSRSLPALGVAIGVLLILDPWQAIHAGFGLSVTATAGILLFAGPISRALHRTYRFPGWLATPIAVSVAAQFACGPLLLLLQPGIPALGVVANVLAAPAAPLGTGCGVLAALLLPIWEGGGSLLLNIAAVPALWIEWLAARTAGIPEGRWPWTGGWLGAALLAFAEGCLIIGVLLLRGKITLGARAGHQRAPWKPIGRRDRRAAVWLSACFALAAGPAAAMIAIIPTVTRWGAPQDWVFVACDVGQGDAILLRDPEDPGGVMLVDTGDDPERLRTCLDRFGVGRIGQLVLTHDDRDHVGALEAIQARVDQVIIAPNSIDQVQSRPLLSRLEAAGLDPIIVSAGDRGGIGDHLVWEALAPVTGTTPADTNGASIVLRAEVGGASVLLLGDTGAEEQTYLLRQPAALETDIVKVAHHGSRDQHPDLYGAVSARYGVVSVGAENRYGHPHPDLLGALMHAGSSVLRTDRDGTIAFAVRDGSLSAYTSGGR